jgi:phosphoribosyl 1,2-cyclic phosphodiesterase
VAHLSFAGVAVNLTILGSGSNGNAAYVETAETRLLIDVGLSGRQIRQRLAGIGRVPENLTAILITHEHSDHIVGLAAIAGKLQLPVYCNRATMEEIRRNLEAALDFRLFAAGSGFEVGDISVETFSVPHDAQDPVGFVLHSQNVRLGFATDLGHVTKLVLERIRHTQALVLESNHDVRMLQDCPHRPWSLKQRILSRHGHLSNEAAADCISEIISDDLGHLYLGHLSRDCNKPEIAQRVMSERLNQLGAARVQLHVASQQVPCPTLSL